MARTPATEAQRRAESSRIQAAASKIYADKGIAAISARAVAKEAGVSVGKLYGYFSSLTELMQSLWQGQVQKLAEKLHRVAKSTPDPMDRIRSVLETYVAFAQHNPDLYKGALMFVRPDELPTPDRQTVEDLPIMALLIGAIEEGQMAGTIRDGPPVRTAQLLWAGLHGALALPVNMDRFAFKEGAHLTRDMVDALMLHIQSSCAPSR